MIKKFISLFTKKKIVFEILCHVIAHGSNTSSIKLDITKFIIYYRPIELMSIKTMIDSKDCYTTVIVYKK